MGRPGGTASQYGAYRACPSGEFPSGKGLGTVYGCGDSGGECPGPPDSIFSVGKTGAVKGTDADEPKASDFNGTTSKSVIGIPWILRMQAFQQSE